jgi:hypothetical protein
VQRVYMFVSQIRNFIREENPKILLVDSLFLLKLLLANAVSCHESNIYAVPYVQILLWPVKLNIQNYDPIRKYITPKKGGHIPSTIEIRKEKQINKRNTKQ